MKYIITENLSIFLKKIKKGLLVNLFGGFCPLVRKVWYLVSHLNFD